MTVSEHANAGDSASIGQFEDAAPSPLARARRHGHLTVDERVARGNEARGEAPRSDHGRWEPAVNRPDPIALLEEQAECRVPELVPIRHGRMLVSPFAFFRGAALIMAAWRELRDPRA